VYKLLVKQFFRSKTVLLAFSILLILGALSIATGKQFLTQKQVAVKQTIEQQKKHIETQVELHKTDIGLLLYYLKFSFVKPLEPIAGIAIGQSDVNSHIQNVKILNLEGQKYDTDLVNPMRLQVGNLDFSFLIIFLFPLVIIALNFNLLSEEEENGTWKMVSLQGSSPLKYLLTKLSIRFAFLLIVFFVLLTSAKIVLSIPLNANFWQITTVSLLYIVFWFAVSLIVILQRRSSNANAIILLTSWLVLVVFLPVLVNNYITNKYSVEEAFTMTIKQRDEYHKKWDTDKKATMDKFYQHYPQFKHYKLQEKGFSWMWYYAMQQMGDDESRIERDLMNEKIRKREQLGKTIAQFFPPLQVQLSMNSIAKTSLSDQMNFLNATTDFHEKLRLNFYPQIFENVGADTVNWDQYKPEYFKNIEVTNIFKTSAPILIITLLLFGMSFLIGKKNF
jgi:ABC-2 type transport system permease protein